MNLPGAVIVGFVLMGTCAAAVEPPGPDWVPRLISKEEVAEGFHPLFNGSDFDGWTIRGANKKTFAAKDGTLLTTGEGGGDWIFTTQRYTNFVLRYAYRVFQQDDNSGVAIRATAEGNPAFTGMEIQVLHPVTEPNAGSAGALYGSVQPAVAADKPFEEWNDVEVLCDKSRIRTTMNGRQLYDIDLDTYDSPDKEHVPLKDRAKTGFIAIQDYGKHVEFRNLRIKPLPGGEGWRSMFNGTNLDGWEKSGGSKCEAVEGGILRVTNKGVRTLEAFKNFELRLMVKACSCASGGVVLRGQGDVPRPDVCEIRLDNHDPEQFTGAIRSHVKALQLRAMDACWYQMHVIANGPDLRVAVNGKTVVDYVNPKYSLSPEGWIGLRGSDPTSVLEFKDIEIKPLP